MVYQQIEKIKLEYTDKYVVVDADRPELARFRDTVGQVKTVNMSGRALVEFGDYHKNIAWYDIDLDFLKVVDKPAPSDKKKAVAKKPAAKKPVASAEKKLSPLEMARMQDAGNKPAAKAKPSTADILAAARAGAAPAAKKEPQAAAPAKTDRSKMSVADMLAAARAETSAPAKEEAAPAAEPKPAAEAAPAETADSGIVKIDRSSMSVDEMVAYCREKDA